MRIEDMTPSHVHRAVEIYLGLAYPPEEQVDPRHPRSELQGAETLEDLFGRFEQRPEEQRGELRHLALRLGNSRYPFMKFVIQEYLVGQELFFTVDTHDQLDVGPAAPDYERWLELKRWNRALKERIERAWSLVGLPTTGELKQLAEQLAGVEREDEKRHRVLVVDDEENVAYGVAALLKGRGYQVETAFSGEMVLERLELDPLPDLVVLDYEMPGMDGEEVLSRLRERPRSAELPVLMATASDIDLARLRRVSGFLRKPYSRQVLLGMIARLLQDRPESAGGAAEGAGGG